MFEWTRDYPIDRQRRYPNGQVKIQLEFELTADELDEFYQQTGSRINSRLPIEILLGNETLSVTVFKRALLQKDQREDHQNCTFRRAETVLSAYSRRADRRVRKRDYQPTSG